MKILRFVVVFLIPKRFNFPFICLYHNSYSYFRCIYLFVVAKVMRLKINPKQDLFICLKKNRKSQLLIEQINEKTYVVNNIVKICLKMVLNKKLDPLHLLLGYVTF